MQDRQGVLRLKTAVDVLLGALAANALAVLATGGFSLYLPFFRIKSSSLPRCGAIIVALLAARFIMTCLGEKSFRTPLRRGVIRAIPVMMIIAAAALAAWWRFGFTLLNAQNFAILCVAAAAALVMAAASYGARTGALGGAAVGAGLTFLGLILILSPHNATIWKTFTSFAFDPHGRLWVSGGVAPRGLPKAEGLEAVVCTLNGDTRPALIMGDGDSFVMPVPAADRRTFACSVGNGGWELGKGDDATITVSLVTGQSGRTLVSSVSRVHEQLLLWTDIECAIGANESGSGVEVSVKCKPSARVAIANPRFVKAGSERPNIILLVVDSLRADHMGLYGYSRATSPEFDQLASSGSVFRKVRAVSTWTVPSMASVFTGLYPTSHGTIQPNIVLPATVTTLAERLSESGYYSAAIQTNFMMTTSRGFARGFAEYHHLPNREPTALDRLTHLRANIIDQYALDWVRRTPDRPYFLYVHYMDVHQPYEPALEYDTFGESRMDKYDGAILGATTEIGRLIKTLESSGGSEKPVVIFTADHGEQFWEHGWYGHGKGVGFEEVNVPLVVWGGFDAAPAVKGGLIENRDIFASILDLAKVKRDDAVSSIAIWRQGEGSTAVRGECFSELTITRVDNRRLWAVETPVDKLIYDSANDRSWYYDVAADLHEAKELEHPDAARLSLLRKAIDEHRAKVAAEKERIVTGRNVLQMTDEEERQLRALGYLNGPGHEWAEPANDSHTGAPK